VKTKLAKKSGFGELMSSFTDAFNGKPNSQPLSQMEQQLEEQMNLSENHNPIENVRVEYT
jgi:hypothetical protein